MATTMDESLEKKSSGLNEETLSFIPNDIIEKVEKLSVRKDWYQTDSTVVITLFLKNLKKEDLSVVIKSQKVTCQILVTNDEHNSNPIELRLLHPIYPEQSSWKVLPTKVEIKLKKQESIWWNVLEGEDLPTVPKQAMAAVVPDHNTISDSSSGAIYPSSCSQKRDWDRIAQDIQKDEENEKLEGESALNQLFQKIYSDGTDEVKKAMNKSFMESGGTVLSTNWKEVGENQVQINPPDGMEFKKWDT